MNEEFCSYIQQSGSFSVLIQKGRSRNRNTIQFKPTITFANIDLEKVENVNRILGGIYQIKEYKQKDKNRVYKIVIQGTNNVNYILDNIVGCDIQSQKRKEVIKNFTEAVKKIQEIGEYHTEWNPKFEEIIDLKREINKDKRTRGGFSGKEWRDMIAKYLEANKFAAEEKKDVGIE